MTEAELGLKCTDLDRLRDMAGYLPFEPAMFMLAVLQARIEPTLRDVPEQWKLAEEFYADRPQLLRRMHTARRTREGWTAFSPQAVALLMRMLLDEAWDEPLRDLEPDERKDFQDAVLGAHTAAEGLIDTNAGDKELEMLAYEIRAVTYFRRAELLEEWARHREFLRLAIEDPRLFDSDNRVPVDEWLEAETGLTIEEQWRLGFGFIAMTQAYGKPIKPRVPRDQVIDLLTKLDLEDVDSDLQQISSTRAEFETAFSGFGGDTPSLLWERRPWKQTPFLRLEDGDLVLLGGVLLLDWAGEGFHYRALTYAQHLGSDSSARYTRYMGEVVERYALDLAESAAAGLESASVLAEQRYGKSEKKTSDVAVLVGRDLFLFEIHSRRVSAMVAVRSGGPEAEKEITTLIVDKIDQLGLTVDALLRGAAQLPGVDLDDVDRIWPCAVSVGHVMQTTNLWNVIRRKVDPEKTASLEHDKVMPVQVFDVQDYEKLLGLLESGDDLAQVLQAKTSGPFRDRDLAAWFHGDPTAPSDRPRMATLEERFGRMTDDVTDVFRRAQGNPNEGANGASAEESAHPSEGE